MGMFQNVINWFRPVPKPAPQPSPKPVIPPVPADWRDGMLDDHNEIRALRGLPPLKLNPSLDKAAQHHAEWMAQYGMSHAGFSHRFEEVGYNYSNCGENIAQGCEDADACTHMWMGDLGHRANVLGKFVDVGFGMSQGFWCADYGTPAEGGEEFSASSFVVRKS